MTYDQTLAADTALAEKTLDHIDPLTGAVVPQNLVSGKLVTHGVDNIDVPKESSTSGNTGYHSTQHAVYQEEFGLPNVDEDAMIFSKGPLQVPNILGAVEQVQLLILKDPPPQSIARVSLHTFKIDKSHENTPRAIDYMHSCCQVV